MNAFIMVSAALLLVACSGGKSEDGSAVGGGGELRGQDLDHDFTPEIRILGYEDARHAAAAELVLEGVGSPKRLLKLITQIVQTATPSSWAGLI